MIRGLLALFFLILGLLCVVVPLSEATRQLLIHFVQSQGLTLFLIGLGFLAIGGVILINLSINAKRRHYALRTGPLAVTVDVDLIHAYVKEYWSRRYPRSDIPFRISFPNKMIQISADLPDTPFLAQKSLLKEIERELQELLATYLGYQRPLRLLISFGE